MLAWGIIGWLCLLSSANAELRIVQVVEYCRHGARTAKEYFPNPKLEKEAALGNSKLIPTGFHQHFLLGSTLKKKYSGLLGNIKGWEIEIMSSQSDRTIESAWSQMNGLLGAGTGPVLTGVATDSDIWLPVFAGVSPSITAENKAALPNQSWALSINIQEERTDHIFQPSEGKAVCPKASAQFSADRKVAYKEYENYPGVTKVRDLLNSKNFKIEEVFKASTKWDVATIGAFFSEINGKRYYYGGDQNDGMDGLTAEDINKIEHVQTLKFGLMYRNETITRLRADKFMREVIQGFDRIKNGTKDGNLKKFRLFSGHDTGLFAVMQRLNLTNLSCILETLDKGTPVEKCELAPTYASNLILELHKDDADSRYWVKCSFNSKPVAICGSAEGLCELDQFKKLMEDNVLLKPAEYTLLCGSELDQARESWSKSTKLPNSNSDSGQIYSYVMMGTIGLLVLLIVLRFWCLAKDVRRRQSLARLAIHQNKRSPGTIKKTVIHLPSERETAYLSTIEDR